MAARHQKNFVHILQYEKLNTHVKSGKLTKVSFEYLEFEDILFLKEFNYIYTTSFLIYDSIHYRQGILIENNESISEINIKSFYEIKHIVYVNQKYLLLCQKYNVIQFDIFHNAYEISPSRIKNALELTNLISNDTYTSSLSRKTKEIVHCNEK